MQNSMVLFNFSVFELQVLSKKSIWHFDITWLITQWFTCRDLSYWLFLLKIITLLNEWITDIKHIPYTAGPQSHFSKIAHLQSFRYMLIRFNKTKSESFMGNRKKKMLIEWCNRAKQRHRKEKHQSRLVRMQKLQEE